MDLRGFFSVTLGNLISIGVFIAGAIAVWQKMKDAIEELGRRMGKQENELEALTRMGIMTTVSQHERRLAAMEESLVTLEETRTDIRWIKKILDERLGSGH